VKICIPDSHAERQDDANGRHPSRGQQDNVTLKGECRSENAELLASQGPGEKENQAHQPPTGLAIPVP